MSPDPSFDHLDATFHAWEQDRDLSGSLLMTRGGTVLFEGSYGMADRGHDVPVTARTRFGLASVTKMFTAVAVADLVAGGDLAFDSRVVDVLPPGCRPSTLLPDVLVHHLLCHTSGIADYAEEDEDSPGYVADYGSLWRERPSHLMQRPADFLPMFGDLPPYRAPGVRFQYCNAGYIVLGLILEEVTGRPYAEVVQERVLDRAGMSASGFFRLDEAWPDVATGYLTHEPADAPWRSNVFEVPVVGGPDGGAFATAADMDRFLRAYGDGTLLGDLTDTVLRPHADAWGDLREGYGVHLWPDGRYGHLGFDPGVQVMVHRWPDDDVNMVVMCNTEASPVVEVRDLLLEAWRG